MLSTIVEQKVQLCCDSDSMIFFVSNLSSYDLPNSKDTIDFGVALEFLIQ